MKVLVIGLDGGTWRVIEPLAARGKIPNLSWIMGGVRGPLESTIPPVTPPAWTSFMTGKNPGKHGLYHFVEPQPGGYGIRYTNARSRKARTIWSMLSEAQVRVGVVNVPMTFPPEPVNGFMISGMDTPDETSDFVHPKALAEEVTRAVGPLKLEVRYLGFMQTDARRRQVLHELEEIDEQRLKTIQYLLDRSPVDVFMVVYGSHDTAQHYFWHYREPTHFRYDAVGAARFGTAVDEVYERMDRHVGALLQRLDEDGVVLLVSDHGFGNTSSRSIFLNRYLAEIGLLTYKPVRPGGRIVSTVQRWLDRTLRGALSSEQKKRIAKLFAPLRQKWETQLTGYDAIDWTRTKAYCSEVLAFPQEIWINVKGRQPQGMVDPGQEYRDLVAFLREKLLTLPDPVTRKPLISGVFTKEEVYRGPYLDHAPDLLLAWWEGDGFSARTSLPEDMGKPVVALATTAASDRVEWTGTHRMDGIFAARGARVRQGERVPSARIVDLAPTILYLTGQPIPDDMDGRVLDEIFEAGSLDQCPISYEAAVAVEADAGDGTYSDAEAEIIKKRLQDLGYVE